MKSHTAGTTRPTIFQRLPTISSEANSNITRYAWQIQKNGLAEATIQTRVQRLKQIARICNLSEPEEVKATLTRLNWNNNTKKAFSQTYTQYLKTLNKTWQTPKFTTQTKIPFIPTETEIDQLIANSPKRTSTLLQTLKETGARIGEITSLKWTQFDTEQRTLNIIAEKGSNPRLLKISDKLTAMLNALPHKNKTIFQTTTKNLRECYEITRKLTSQKLQNPRLLQISYHTFRHWKGTTEYHKTKDIIHVKTILGHKSIQSTMIYINIEQALFLTDSDEWTCKTAKTIQEATQLIEAGFQYIDTMDGIKLYKKRK